MEASKRGLMRHGMALFLLGLITGLAERNFLNPRMGLAAHLEGVMNGTFLIAAGAAWGEVELNRPMRNYVYFAFLAGAYLNWATTSLAAVWGAAALSPITSDGRSATAWREAIVTAGFGVVGLLMLSATAIALWGLRGAGRRAFGKT
ncbi:MAG TPA: hydrogenase [Roseiarcus sp.]|nr:hydrogenase [Roseiarcus sp.]